MPPLGGVHRQHHVLHRLHRLDLLRHQRQQLRHQRIEPLQVREQLLDVVGHGVDAVERVEHRPHRPADRDVVAVRFPVEVVADRAEEIVEIGDVVPQFGDVDGHVAGLFDHAVRRRAHLAHQRDHPGHRVDGLLHLVGLHQHVVHAVLEVLAVQVLADAAHAHLRRNGAELNGFAARAGDRLHAPDAGHPEDRLGDLVDHQEVRRVAQVVVAFDEQQFGVHRRGREVPFGRGETLIGGQVLRAGTCGRCSWADSPAG